VRVFLDECIDWRLSRDIGGYDVKTARQMGWTAIKNGELLALAAAHFDAFVTVDRNLSFQQNCNLTDRGDYPSCKEQQTQRPPPARARATFDDRIREARNVNCC
jgi:hypothetical protein